MKVKWIAFCALAAATLAVSDASAQGINLTGQYQCVQGCAGGAAGLAVVTQNGWDLNVVNEVGMPTRAWIDWPGHIWTDAWQMGAVYSPDGLAIQFDNGTVWQRFVPPPPPPPPPLLHSRG